MENNNSNQKYLELKENLINALQSDEFYELFNRSIKSGKNNFSQYQRYMNNIIDPSWVKAIEDCIIPIDNIIRNPMRFIKQEEEIVNIEQARKISQESIRHLAQNTNMIQKVDKKGMVTPSKILNILKEETYATYENRFIYTLLKHLQYFIDKRLRILNDSKVQTENKVSLESEFTIGKEKLKYEFSLSSIEKTEKNRKTFKIDEDTSQMDLMHRIERLRMIIFDFQNSQLIKSLEGCLQVRPPIMRTNVILKNPNFKQALELWTFIESYNDVGLSIQVMENEEIPNEAYIEDMFNVTLVNYYMFNKYVKPEKDLEKSMPVSREFKPNLVHKTVEEFIDEFDMDIDDIEKIFIDKVKKATEKRKENEKKIKEAIDRALKLERARKKKLLEQEKKRKEKERLMALRAEERARKQALREEEKAKKLALIEEEKARKLALKEEEKKRKEEERRRLLEEKERALKAKQEAQEKVLSNFELVRSVIRDNYPKAKIIVNGEKEFSVYQSIGILLLAKCKVNEYKLVLKAKEDFVNEFNEKHNNIMSVDNSQKAENWYKIIDKGTLNEDDLKEVIVHTFEYDRQLRFEKAQITRAKTRLLKEKKLSEEMMDELIQKINEYVQNNYKYGQFKGKENSYKITRRRVMMNALQKKGYFIRLDLPAKKAFATKLYERFPNHIEKLGKKKEWYKLVINGEMTMDDIIEILDNSYNYLANAEARFIAKYPDDPEAQRIIKANQLEEERARKIALREEEKARKLALKEEELARKQALKEEELARKQAIKDEKLARIQEAKEQELRAKQEYLDKIKANYELVREVISSTYPKAKIKANGENEFTVHQSIGALLMTQFKETEYKISFKAKEEFVNDFNEKHENIISVDKSLKGGNWYKIVDKIKMTEDDLKEVITHTFEYDKELRFEKAQITRARTRAIKEKKLNEDMMNEIIERIREHIQTKYKGVQMKGEDKTFKITRRRIVMNTLQKKGYFIRLDLPAKKGFASKLFEKYPNHIEKYGKRKEWYKLALTGEMSIEEILKFIDNSYKYLALAEAKAKALKEEQKAKETEININESEVEVIEDNTSKTEVEINENVGANSQEDSNNIEDVKETDLAVKQEEKTETRAEKRARERAIKKEAKALAKKNKLNKNDLAEPKENN